MRGTAADDSIAIAKQGSAYVVTDAGVSFSAADVDGCEAVGGNAVCAADVQTILIDAGAGNDSVSIDDSIPPEIEVRIEGGPGADQLHGGPGGDVIEAGDDNDPDLLEGGPGDDALVGARTDLPVPYNSGKSTLIGGPGSDVMVGGDPCDGDVFDGGPGEDDANFFRFTPGVTAEIGGPVSACGQPLHPRSHRFLGRAARGLPRPGRADRRPPRQPDRARRAQQAAPAPLAPAVPSSGRAEALLADQRHEAAGADLLAAQLVAAAAEHGQQVGAVGGDRDDEAAAVGELPEQRPRRCRRGGVDRDRLERRPLRARRDCRRRRAARRSSTPSASRARRASAASDSCRSTPITPAARRARTAAE